MKMKVVLSFMVGALVICFVSCGPDKIDLRGGKTPKESDLKPNPGPTLDNAIVRARFFVPLQTSDETVSFLAGRSVRVVQPITGTVAPAVRFEVNADNFVTPPDPIDLESYGTLDVDRLRDNNLRVCGQNGDQKCQPEYIRIYTEGTPGPGLWNTAGQYGIPILSDASEVGLDPANAYVVGTFQIGARRVVRLRNFADPGPLLIPVSVDFSDAGAGEYASTLVIEYCLE